MEKPVVVYSSWLGADYQGVLKQKDLAFISNKLAQKAGYKTILYADKLSKEFLNDIPFSEVVDFDDNILKQLPKTLWAAGKLLAISKQKDPFIHLDFDLFIFKNIFLEKVWDKDFFVFHNEPWSIGFGNNDIIFQDAVKKILDISNNNFDLNLNKQYMSLNFSMFGTTHKENSLIIAKEADSLILNLIKINKILENVELQKYFEKNFKTLSTAMISIIIEQIIFPNILIQRRKYSYSPILDVKTIEEIKKASINLGLLHLWGMKNNNTIRKILHHSQLGNLGMEQCL